MSEKSKSKRTAPLWITLLAVALAACAISAFALASMQNFEIALPFFEEYAFIDSDLIIEDRSYQYEMATMRYDNITLTVRNTDIAQHAGTIAVTLYTTGDVEIASGTTTTGSINGGTAVAVTVDFTWVGSYTVADLLRGLTQLQQTS